VSTADDEPAVSRAFLPSLAAFLGDFIRYAGRRILLAGALVGGGALLEGLGLVLLVPILSVVMGSGGSLGGLRAAAESLFQAVGAQTQFDRLALLLGLFGVLMLVRAAIVTWRDVFLAQLQIGFLEAQRASVAELLAGARWDELVRLRHARITHLMSGDIQRVSTGASFLLQTTVSLVMLAAQCALALMLSPALAAVAIALLVVMGLALGPMVRRSQRLGAYVTGANLALLDSASQFLGGLKLAVSQNLQGAFTDEFRQTLRALTNRQVDNIRTRTFGRLAINLLSAATGAAILLIGFGVLRLPASVLITLLLIISRMTGPVGQIQQGLQQVAAALPAYDKVLELKAELAAVADRGVDVPAGPFPTGEVVFDNVTFLHPGDGPERGGVEGLTLTLAPGDILGVAGASGAGKTTFADLLVGLFAPQSGKITVGGQGLDGATLAAWRGGVSYVSQDPFLFHDTVRRNLAWADPAADEARMWAALELADAASLVRRMDLGLDTLVGERGALVSGGERQRIALARAVLRQPRCLILDEATNAIDIPAERALLERLLSMSPRPTIVLIAHRPESLALCRTILTLDQGRLVGRNRPVPPGGLHPDSAGQ
jgi:ATP-binding cassette subfamily C protein